MQLMAAAAGRGGSSLGGLEPLASRCAHRIADTISPWAGLQLCTSTRRPESVAAMSRRSIDMSSPLGSPALLKQMSVAIVPGTGQMGKNLARHFCARGFRVLIGSRDEAKAKALAASLRTALSTEDFTAQAEGYTNASAAAAADVVFWAIQAPLAERHAVLASLAPELQNKVVVDITNIGYLPEFKANGWSGQTSSTLQNAEVVPGARWVAAWKQTFWKLLETPPNRPHSVFVCGNDPEALGLTMRLVEQVPGFHPVDGGGLANTAIIEPLVPWIVELDKLNTGGNFRGGFKFGL